MNPFMVSAPGKAILFGEYAAVYGRPAIAAAIGLRTYLLVTRLPHGKRTISLISPDNAMHYVWDIDDLPWAVFKDSSKSISSESNIPSLKRDLVDALEPHLNANRDPNGQQDHRSALAFLYIYLSLESRDSPGAVYKLRSSIPTGAGLGSSASFSVCIATSILLQTSSILAPLRTAASHSTYYPHDLINRWAFVGELCIHGNPSGVDNTTSCRGGALIFQRDTHSRIPTITPLDRPPSLKALLVDTRQTRSTATILADFGRLKDTHPDTVDSILDQIHAATECGWETIQHLGVDQQRQDLLGRLGDLMTTNHDLLAHLGASHPRLERVRSVLGNGKIGWTKLTGSGRGGCAVSLLHPGQDDGGLENVVETLTAEGFDVYRTVLGGRGVSCLFPSIAHFGDEADQTFLQISVADIEAFFGDIWMAKVQYWI